MDGLGEGGRRFVGVNGAGLVGGFSSLRTMGRGVMVWCGFGVWLNAGRSRRVLD